MSTITINNKEYALADLNAQAQQQVASIQVVDAEVSKLQQQLAIYQTARNAYVQALVLAVEGETPAKAAKKPRSTKAKA